MNIAASRYTERQGGGIVNTGEVVSPVSKGEGPGALKPMVAEADHPQGSRSETETEGGGGIVVSHVSERGDLGQPAV